MIRQFFVLGVVVLSMQTVRALETGVGHGDLAVEDVSVWNDIRPDIFGDRIIHDGAGLVLLEAPFRAETSELTPITIRTSLGAGRKASRLTVVIDENPAPVAGVFTFGPMMQEIDLSTRIRVDRYSHVRAIVETDSGELFMTSSFVRASGGCSAPAVRDPVESARTMGQIRLRQFAQKSGDDLAEAQAQIRHPNYSGLQMDQISMLYIPAHFINMVEVSRGEESIFRMEGGISISENPSFRFRYDASGATAPVTVRAMDTQGNTFAQSFTAAQQ